MISLSCWSTTLLDLIFVFLCLVEDEEKHEEDEPEDTLVVDMEGVGETTDHRHYLER